MNFLLNPCGQNIKRPPNKIVVQEIKKIDPKNPNTIIFAPFYKIKTKCIKQIRWILAGVLFAILWSSASTATKFALQSAQPLVIAQVRFAIAGILMLIFAHTIFKRPIPQTKYWIPLSIYALLNITIYLGCYVIAMKYVTAGIGALAIATNPIYISFLSVFFLKKKLTVRIIIALIAGSFGVFFASLPLLHTASVSTSGLLLLLFSMLSYSAGAIYFSSRDWGKMTLLTINGWQTFLGGIFLLPFTLLTYMPVENHYHTVFWINTFWLAVAVSIAAVQLWLWLLKINTVKAGLWLFLCPVSGLLIAAWLIHEPLTYHTYIGLSYVLFGLLLTETFRKRRFHKKVEDPMGEMSDKYGFKEIN